MYLQYPFKSSKVGHKNKWNRWYDGKMSGLSPKESKNNENHKKLEEQDIAQNCYRIQMKTKYQVQTSINMLKSAKVKLILLWISNLLVLISLILSSNIFLITILM